MPLFDISKMLNKETISTFSVSINLINNIITSILIYEAIKSFLAIFKTNILN